MVTWEQVVGWVRGAAPEGETLDFKGAFWPDKGTRPRAEEIAKDVAAFLNNRGGVLVVGVADDADRAAGFTGVPLPDNAEQMVMQALQRHLVPQAASGPAHAYVVTGPYDGVAYQVLIIEVGGWAHGPVAVRIGEGLYRLPIRKGAHTEEIPWEQAMRDLAGSHRRNWLRFREWHEKHERLPVFIGTGIRAVTNEGGLLPIPCPVEDHFAELAGVDEDVVHLRVMRTAYTRWVVGLHTLKPAGAALREAVGEPVAAFLGALGAREAWNNNMPVNVAVPFELIRAAWVERMAQSPRLHLLLDGDLIYGGERWYLRPASG